MALNDIKFEKINGGMGRTAPNEDVNSGLIMSLDGNITADVIFIIFSGRKDKPFFNNYATLL